MLSDMSNIVTNLLVPIQTLPVGRVFIQRKCFPIKKTPWICSIDSEKIDGIKTFFLRKKSNSSNLSSRTKTPPRKTKLAPFFCKTLLTALACAWVQSSPENGCTKTRQSFAAAMFFIWKSKILAWESAKSSKLIWKLEKLWWWNKNNNREISTGDFLPEGVGGAPYPHCIKKISLSSQK